MKPAMRTFALATVLLIASSASAQHLSHEVAERGGTVTISLSIPVASTPLVIDAEFSFPVDAASIHLRPLATGDSYTEVAGTQVGNSDQHYRATIDASLITSRGIEFYMSYLEDGVVSTIPSSNPQASPLRYPVLTVRIRADVNLAPLRYRMISIPFQFVEGVGPQAGSGTLASVFADDFGSYDPRRWRVLRWNPVSETYDEGTSAVPKVEPGEAFWLITSSGGDFDVEGGITPGFELGDQAVQEVPVSVIASPGWTQVGNPFLYPIGWDNVQGAQSVQEPVGYTASGYEPGQTTLQPWTGYFVFNPGTAPIDLRFQAPVGPVAPRSQVPYAQRLLDSLPSGSFAIQLVAMSGDFTDAHTYLVGSTAKVAARKPPGTGAAPRISILGDDAEYLATTADTPLGPWLIEVQRSEDDSQVTVQMHEHGFLPPGSAIEVREADSGRLVHAPGGTFDVVGGETQRFVARVAAGNDLEGPSPAERLAQPYPNPAAEAQTLMTYVWAEGRTVLDVFDVLGRHVRSIAIPDEDGGWQPIILELTDVQGRPLTAGTYVLRLQSSGGTASRSFTIIR